MARNHIVMIETRASSHMLLKRSSLPENKCHDSNVGVSLLLIQRYCLTIKRIFMITTRQSDDCIISKMEIFIPGKTIFILK